MTSYYYITGTSRGIGRALTERLLIDPDSRVVGMSRSTGPVHPNYRHVSLDLADLEAVSAFRFERHADAERVVLVNNAGTLTPKFLGKQDYESVVQSYAINIMAPILLIGAFIAAYGETETHRIICSTGSVAATRPIPGASLYCSGKAALDMLSQVLAKEAETVGRQRFDVFCVDPGPVDTETLGRAMMASEDDFPDAPRYRQLKEDGQLADPKVIAERMARVLLDPSLAPGTVFRLVDLPLA